MRLYGVSRADHDDNQQLTHRRVHVGAHGGMDVARRALLILVKGLRQELAVGHEALHERHCATNSLCESPTCLYLDFGRVPVQRYVSDLSTDHELRTLAWGRLLAGLNRCGITFRRLRGCGHGALAAARYTS